MQSGLSTTVTTDTVCATFTGLNGFADRIVSVVDTEAFKTCRTRCTVSGTTGGTEDDVAVALCAGGPLPRSGHCASFHVIGVVVSATVVDEASATAATCNCNGGTVDDQSGGATTGSGVGNTLQGELAGQIVLTCCMMLEGRGWAGWRNRRYRSLRHPLRGSGVVTDTTGCTDELNGLAGLDLDDTGDLSTGTCCHIVVVGTTSATDDLELNLVDQCGNNERSGALSAKRYR